MSEQYRFFDSVEGEDERFYTADEFAEYFRQVISTGILNGGTNLKVASDGVDMTVQIKEGYAWIEGYLYKVDIEPLILTLGLADPTLNRIDRIVIRLDKSLEQRYVRAFVLKGASADQPVPPEITRDENVFEIALAQVKVMAGKSFIEDLEITDERLNTAVCGMANSLITADTTEIFNQFQAWYDSKTSQWQEDWNNWWALNPDVYEVNFQKWREDNALNYENWRVDSIERFEEWFANQKTEGFVMANEKGQVDGIPVLDENAKVPIVQLPPMDYLTSKNRAKIKEGEVVNVNELAFLDKSTGLIESMSLEEKFRHTYNRMIPEKNTTITSSSSSQRVLKLKDDMYISSYALNTSLSLSFLSRVFKLDEQGNYTLLSEIEGELKKGYTYQTTEIENISYSMDGLSAYAGIFLKARQNDGYFLYSASILKVDLDSGEIEEVFNDITEGRPDYKNGSGNYKFQSLVLGDGNFVFAHLTSDEYRLSYLPLRYALIAVDGTIRNMYKSVLLPPGTLEILVNSTADSFGPLGADSFSFLLWDNTNARWYVYKVKNASSEVPDMSYELLEGENTNSKRYLGSCFSNGEYASVYRIGTGMYKVTNDRVEKISEEVVSGSNMTSRGKSGTHNSTSQINQGSKLYFSSSNNIEVLDCETGEVENILFTEDFSSIIHNREISLICSLDQHKLQIMSDYIEYQGGILLTEFTPIPINKNIVQVKELVDHTSAVYELTLKDEAILRGDKIYLDVPNKSLSKTGSISYYLGESIKDKELSKPLIKRTVLYYKDLYVLSLLAIPIPSCDRVNIKLAVGHGTNTIQLISLSLNRRSLMDGILMKAIYPRYPDGSFCETLRGSTFTTNSFGTVLLSLNNEGLEIGRAASHSRPTEILTIKEIEIEVINDDACGL